MQKSWRWRAVAIGSVVLLGLGACSDDDGDDDVSASEADTEADAADSDDVTAFCGLVSDVGLGVAIGEGHEGLDDALVAAEKIAPAEVEAAVTAMADENRAQVDAGPPPEGTPARVPPEEFFRASEEVGDYVAESCGYPVIDVSSTEYAFEGIPATAARGNTLFRVTNDGEEWHQLVLQRVRYGEDRSVDEILALPDGGGDLLDYQGGAVVPPGMGGWFVVKLGVGRHAAMCFMPVGATTAERVRSAEADGAPTHYSQGETAEINVP